MLDKARMKKLRCTYFGECRLGHRGSKSCCLADSGCHRSYQYRRDDNELWTEEFEATEEYCSNCPERFTCWTT